MSRLLDGEALESEKLSHEGALRPKSFEHFPGQETVKKKLNIFIGAAKKRKESLDHVLLSGPPGLGKNNIGPYHCQQHRGFH